MRLNITKSWFHSAGKQYFWADSGYDVRGIGIEAGLLKKYPEIEIVVDKVVYKLDSNKAIEFVSKFKSFYQAKGTLIAVVSKSLLKTVRKPVKENISANLVIIDEVDNPPQLELFTYKNTKSKTL